MTDDRNWTREEPGYRVWKAERETNADLTQEIAKLKEPPKAQSVTVALTGCWAQQPLKRVRKKEGIDGEDVVVELVARKSLENVRVRFEVVNEAGDLIRTYDGPPDFVGPVSRDYRSKPVTVGSIHYRPAKVVDGDEGAVTDHRCNLTAVLFEGTPAKKVLPVSGALTIRVKSFYAPDGNEVASFTWDLSEADFPFAHIRNIEGDVDLDERIRR